MTGPQDSSTPERTLRHTVDVTADDAWAVMEFLMPRLEALERAHGGGTEEYRTAGALAQIMSGLVLKLDAEILGPSRAPYRGRSAPPSAPALTEDEARAEAKRRLNQIRESWNDLCEIVRPWRETKDYAQARWHKVAFHDPHDEAEYNRRCAELGLRQVERP
ncbi:hypothetical protein ACIP46_36155 [Streptomyces lavendulae]|uniref:hypothetical protein n=1 Tax=Streptomyces lavendulae TaxID=1914 RepID=UPI00380B7336